MKIAGPKKRRLNFSLGQNGCDRCAAERKRFIKIRRRKVYHVGARCRNSPHRCKGNWFNWYISIFDILS